MARNSLKLGGETQSILFRMLVVLVGVMQLLVGSAIALYDHQDIGPVGIIISFHPFIVCIKQKNK